MNKRKLSLINERRLRYKNDIQFRDDKLLSLLQLKSIRIMEKLYNNNFLFNLAYALPVHDITRTIDVDIKVLADRNLNLAINSLKRRIKLFLIIANSVAEQREISHDYLTTLGRREYEEVVEVWEKNLKYAKKLRKAYYYILSKVKFSIRMNARQIGKTQMQKDLMEQMKRSAKHYIPANIQSLLDKVPSELRDYQKLWDYQKEFLPNYILYTVDGLDLDDDKSSIDWHRHRMQMLQRNGMFPNEFGPHERYMTAVGDKLFDPNAHNTLTQMTRAIASTIDVKDHLDWCKGNESRFYTSDNLLNLELNDDYHMETDHRKGKVVILGGMGGALGAAINHCLALPISIHPKPDAGVMMGPVPLSSNNVNNIYLGNGKNQHISITDDLLPRCVYVKKLNDEDQTNLFQFKDTQQTSSEFRADLKKKTKKKPFQVMNEKINRKKR